MAKASASIDISALKVAGEANKYITHINDGGITVHDAVNQNLNYVQIDSNGMEIFKSDGEAEPSAVSIANFGENVRIGKISGGNLLATSQGIAVRDGMTDLATFGASGAQIGKTDSYHIEITNKSLKGCRNQSHNTFFNMQEMGGEPVTAQYIVDGHTKTFDIHYFDTSTLVVTVDGVQATWSLVGTTLYLDNMPSEGAVVNITGVFNGDSAPSFSFGQVAYSPQYPSTQGGFSGMFGHGCNASGYCAFVEGYSCQAVGEYSHAEGNGSDALGSCSHAQNYGTIASGKNQTAIGRFNVEDTGNRFALIVGNGNNQTRSNALTVDWDGNVDASGTVLGKLKRVGAITGEAPSTEPTLASGTSWKNLQTITLTKGVWMVTIGAEFAGNSTGIRAITLSTGSSGATTAGTVIRTVRTAPASTGLTCLQATFPVEVSSTSQVFYLNAFQNSGSTLTVKPRYTAIKLGNSTST